MTELLLRNQLAIMRALCWLRLALSAESEALSKPEFDHLRDQLSRTKAALLVLEQDRPPHA